MIKQCKGYDTKSLRAKDWARTPVTHGEGVKHPHATKRVGLSWLFRAFVANVGMLMPFTVRPRAITAMPSKICSLPLKIC